MCIDTNECDINNGGCEYDCQNTEGSYECECKEGYQLADDKHSCEGKCKLYVCIYWYNGNCLMWLGVFCTYISSQFT